MFGTSTGNGYSRGNVLGRGLYRALDRAGLPRVSFHSLRHSHASLWIKDFVVQGCSRCRSSDSVSH